MSKIWVAIDVIDDVHKVIYACKGKEGIIRHLVEVLGYETCKHMCNLLVGYGRVVTIQEIEVKV